MEPVVLVHDRDPPNVDDPATSVDHRQPFYTLVEHQIHRPGQQTVLINGYSRAAHYVPYIGKSDDGRSHDAAKNLYLRFRP